MTDLVSPYRGGDGEWLCGNLHTHTTESDGEEPIRGVIDAYEAHGYDFLAITDHDRLVDPERYRSSTEMVLLPGVEITDGGPHLLALGVDETIPPHRDRQHVLNRAEEIGALTAVAHPNWGPEFSHIPWTELDRLSGYAAVEVYNRASSRGRGSPLATDRWDRLLAAGRRVWGIGTDDTHRPEDVGSAWTAVRAADRTPRAILDALRAGRCYASTGVSITSIGVDGPAIEVVTEDADAVRLLSDHGAVQRTVESPEAAFRVPDDLRYHDDHTYVRVECLGDRCEVAWTQPFWLDGA